MHTYKSTCGATFNFNTDFSGNVEIKCGDQKCSIPANSLLEFIAYEYIEPRKIAKIENMTYRDLLDL